RRAGRDARPVPAVRRTGGHDRLLRRCRRRRRDPDDDPCRAGPAGRQGSRGSFARERTPADPGLTTAGLQARRPGAAVHWLPLHCPQEAMNRAIVILSLSAAFATLPAVAQQPTAGQKGAAPAAATETLSSGVGIRHLTVGTGP